MVTSNERIVEAAWDGLAGKYWLPDQPGMCLAFVRVIVERALELPERHFYRAWVTQRVETTFPAATRDPIARDAERSFTALGWNVPFEERQPGDLLFDFSAAYRRDWGTTLGHTAILLEGDRIAENTEHPSRGLRKLSTTRLPTAIALTPLEEFVIRNDHNKGLPTRVIRLPG